MKIYLFIVFIFLILASAINYVAYSHIQRYKYYKNVSKASFSQYLGGIFMGLPLIIVPFVTREKDRDFMKYRIIKQSVYLSRLFIAGLLIALAVSACAYIIK